VVPQGSCRSRGQMRRGPVECRFSGRQPTGRSPAEFACFPCPDDCRVENGRSLVPLNLQAGKSAIAANLLHADVAGVVLPRGMEQIAQEIAEVGIPAVTAPLEGPPPTFEVRSASLSDPDTAVLFYTSGTTGTPKAVPVSHGNLLDNVDRSVKHFTDLEEGDTFLNVLPNFHALGFTTSGLLPLVGGFHRRFFPPSCPPKRPSKPYTRRRFQSSSPFPR